MDRMKNPDAQMADFPTQLVSSFFLSCLEQIIPPIVSIS
jgi:hypothetical protein